MRTQNLQKLVVMLIILNCLIVGILILEKIASPVHAQKELKRKVSEIDTIKMIAPPSMPFYPMTGKEIMREPLGNVVAELITLNFSEQDVLANLRAIDANQQGRLWMSEIFFPSHPDLVAYNSIILPGGNINEYKLSLIGHPYLFTLIQDRNFIKIKLEKSDNSIIPESTARFYMVKFYRDTILPAKWTRMFIVFLINK